MSKYIFIFFFFCSGLFAQNINQYKYVEVPQRFDFQKEKNAFNINVLTKLLLQKYEFVAYMDDEIKPAGASQNICDEVLHVQIDEESTLFVRKLTVKLLDCNNKVVFATKQGESSTKDLRVAYNQALRMAFESFDNLGYKYKESASAKVIAAKNQNTSEDGNNEAEIQFVAKTIENGFLLQSTSLPEIKMQKSNVENFYIAQVGDLPAVIYQNGSVWKLDFYKNSQLQSKIIEIKF